MPLADRRRGARDSGDGAGPVAGGGLVDAVGLAVEVRGDAGVDPLVAVGVRDAAGDAVEVAEPLGAAVPQQPRRARGALTGEGRLDAHELLALDRGGLGGEGLAVRPLEGLAGEGVVAVRVR